LLLDAFTKAGRQHFPAGVPPVSSARLVEAGLSHTELQGLVCEGLVEQRDHVALANGSPRTGPDVEVGRQPDGDGYALTPCGAVAVFSSLYAPGHVTPAVRVCRNGRYIPDNGRERPLWDDAARGLWWRCRLIKHFRNDAANQRLILRAFEEQGWPQKVDDSLPRAAGVRCKVQLREAVRSLHRGQSPLVLRFRADGAGTGIRWEPIA
jgi:hypothetical protein